MPYSYRTLLKDLVFYIRPYGWRFVFGTVLRLSGDIVLLYAIFALSKMISLLSGGTAAHGVWFYFTVLVVGQGYQMIIRQVAKYFCYRVAERAKIDCELRALRHLSLLDIAWHGQENTGNKMKRVYSAGEGVNKLLRIWVDNILEIAVNFTGMLLIIASINTAIALALIVFLLTYLCVSVPLARRSSAAARVVNQYEETSTGLAFEILNNIRTVKVMDMSVKLLERLRGAAMELYGVIATRVGRFRIQSGTQSVWAHCFRTALTGFIVFGILHGHYEIGFLILFNFYFTSLRDSAEELSNVSQDIVIARYHLGRLHDVLDEEVRIDNDSGKVDFPNNWQMISLRNVSFAYGDHIVLDTISVDIRRGERIGIVGLSGAGKSTLFKLLCKEYEDFTGDILFDGISIRSIKKSSYLQKIAVVLQETEVFNFSLKDNITIAGSSGADDDLHRAIAVAHVAEFVPKLPDGIETLIGEKGVKLSGGEKQRLGIARAIYRNPDILFLDEATSHLDLESEEKIKDSLHRFFQNVTAVVIAHRLTTIQEMDRILLIERGRLLEDGSFAQLHEKRGRFFDLWEMQKL